MSYILDALKKADQERTLGEVPDLDAAHWGERRRRKSTQWIWVVVLLLLINGALLVFMLGDDDGSAVSESGVKDTVATDRPPLRRPETRPAQTIRKIERPREPVYMPPSVPSVPPPARVLDKNLPVPGSAPVVRAPPPVIAVPVPARPPVAASSVPEWHELSLEFRDRFIAPKLDVHVYSEEPGRRFILVDLQKYREGEMLENGAVLEKILPDSIQLNFEGTRFRVDK